MASIVGAEQADGGDCPSSIVAGAPDSSATAKTVANNAVRPAGSVVLADWRATLSDEDRVNAPPDLDELFAFLARAELYVQDEAVARLMPTLTRVWSRRGRREQRIIHVYGNGHAKFVVYGAVDWRTGWTSWVTDDSCNAVAFRSQNDHLVKRSSERGRAAMIIIDNASFHKSSLIKDALQTHGDKLRLVYLPPYSPHLNPIEQLWRPFRHAVTHNHRRTRREDLLQDAETYMGGFDQNPNSALSHIGSPFAKQAIRQQEDAES